MDLHDLPDEQRDALVALVHERAAEVADEVVAQGQEVEYLVREGWSVEYIEERLSGSGASVGGVDASLVTVDQVTAAGPYATWSHRGRTTVRVVGDAQGRPRVDDVGRVLVQHDTFDDERWWVLPRDLRPPDPG